MTKRLTSQIYTNQEQKEEPLLTTWTLHCQSGLTQEAQVPPAICNQYYSENFGLADFYWFLNFRQVPAESWPKLLGCGGAIRKWIFLWSGSAIE